MKIKIKMLKQKIEAFDCHKKVTSDVRQKNILIIIMKNTHVIVLRSESNKKNQFIKSFIFYYHCKIYYCVIKSKKDNILFYINFWREKIKKKILLQNKIL